MTGVDTRSVARDSLFLLANITIENESDAHRVRVRNLSDGGMMAEGPLVVQRGYRLEIELRNIGKIGGSVAWVQDKRFGIAFDSEIDSQRARKPVEPGEGDPTRTVEISRAHRAPTPPDPSTLRKV
ncbi:MAG: PilZ domain-containing protein [Erythrobacter sp.]|nr:PilZ domain-containing protein [Erythrobacter sp.]